MESLIETPWHVDISVFAPLLTVARHAPTVQIMEGSPVPPPDDGLVWMFVSKQHQTEYEVSALWNTDFLYPTWITRIVQHVNRVTGLDIADTEFYLARTRGQVPKHQDVSRFHVGAKLNVGVENTQSARTNTYVDDTDEVRNSIVMQDGVGYLLDPREFHSVAGTQDFRYIATFRLPNSIAELKNKWKHHEQTTQDDAAIRGGRRTDGRYIETPT